MKDLSLGEFLRYGVAGTVFLGMLALLRSNGLPPPGQLQGMGDAAVLVVVAITVGAVVYGLHRALVYPFFYSAFGKRVAGTGQRIAWGPLVQKWDVKRAEARTDEKHVVAGMRTWADQIHMLYTSAWSVLGALVVELWVFPGGVTCCALDADVSGAAAAALGLGVLCLAGAATAHWRYLKREWSLLFDGGS